MKGINNICDELEKQPQKKYVGKWLTERKKKKNKKFKEVCNEYFSKTFRDSNGT